MVKCEATKMIAKSNCSRDEATSCLKKKDVMGPTYSSSEKVKFGGGTDL